MPYGGFLDAFAARLVCAVRRAPLLVDALISIHETVVEDRALLPAQSLQARLILGIERWGVRLCTAVLVDTEENATFMAARYGLPPARLHVLPVGCDENDYHPLPTERNARPEDTEVIFYGKFIPLHGIEIILEAAQRLAPEPGIHFTFYGNGQTYAAMRALAEELGLSRVSWRPGWLPAAELAREIAGADICLGIFGASAKAQRVIPTKAYVALAMGKPLVTMGSPTARRLLTHGETAMLSVPGDATSWPSVSWRCIGIAPCGPESAPMAIACSSENTAPPPSGPGWRRCWRQHAGADGHRPRRPPVAVAARTMPTKNGIARWGDPFQICERIAIG